ncbi:MAG: hypothetical protein ACOC4Y_01915 [bacterium]
MNEYTEGTWKAKQTQDKLIEISTDDYFICFLSWADEKHEKEQKANAQLIAAAPDLLEAAEEILQNIQKLLLAISENEVTIDEIEYLLDNEYKDVLQPAIAKAKGDTDAAIR